MLYTVQFNKTFIFQSIRWPVKTKHRALMSLVLLKASDFQKTAYWRNGGILRISLLIILIISITPSEPLFKLTFLSKTLFIRSIIILIIDET